MPPSGWPVSARLEKLALPKRNIKKNVVIKDKNHPGVQPGDSSGRVLSAPDGGKAQIRTPGVPLKMGEAAVRNTYNIYNGVRDEKCGRGPGWTATRRRF